MRCQAALRLFSDTRPAAEVTVRLGIEPTTSHERGDRLGARTRAVARQSGWVLSTDVREPSDLHEHLIELLDRVEPVRDRLLELTHAGWEMDWFCFVEAVALEHAVELDHDLLRRLAALPGALLIDTYGKDEQDAP